MSESSITSYVKKRYFAYTIVTFIAFVLPFIKIHGNHFFLLSFDKKQLHLFFVQFDMQELYLMPFLLITMFLTIFFLTTLGGRVWCGWACPQTCFRVIYRDLIQTKLLKIRQNIKNKQKKIEGQYIKRFIALVIWACLALVAVSNLLWYFIPPEDYFSYLKNPSEHGLLIGIILVITLFLVADIIFIKENFCVYICPYARVQSVMFDVDTIQVIYDESRGGKVYEGHTKLAKKPTTIGAECIGCESCVAVCPTHIDIRKGMQLECINCLECADACSKVMSKFGKSSLISWTSKNALETRSKVRYFRFRTVAYMVVIAIALIGLVVMSGKKENMLLNINRTSELYKIDIDENSKIIVENAYTFLFQNTDRSEHEYYFQTSDDRIKISRPTNSIKLKAGAKRKVIVVLETNHALANEERKDAVIPIEIYAYAKDDIQRVNVSRKTIFVYPKKEVITEKVNAVK